MTRTRQEDKSEPRTQRSGVSGLCGRLLRCAACAALAFLAFGCNSFSLHLLSRDKNDKGVAELRPVTPAPPSRYSFRIPPFVFLSDFEIDRDKPLFEELAKLRDQVYTELRLTPGRSAVQVYLFETKERYDEYMHAAYPNLPARRAFFIQQQRALGGTDELMVYTSWGDRIQQDLRHELTHALLHSVIRDVPLWLDEGLAEYFELPPSEHGINASHVETLRRDYGITFQPDLERLERMKDVNEMKGPEYREAWLWVHWMMKANPETKTVLLTYLQDLRKGNPGPLGTRLAAVCPKLKDEFKKHLDQLELPINARSTPSSVLSIPR
ncbi:MAG TPA: DUF1570 domain-containing protein [Gemmataceae bacterium]|nr:DUF1570 domain-containing protein [Gemmataceae bacterium]